MNIEETGVPATMSKRARRGALMGLLAGLGAAMGADAYEVNTHMALSAQAGTLSTLGSVLEQYGLGIAAVDNDGVYTPLVYPGQDSNHYPYAVLINLGSKWEDDGFRSLNHFFNPVNNSALPVPLYKTYPSPAWALEDSGQIEGQDYSYADARQYYWTAVTSPDPAARNSNLGLTFQALGHVIHHLQDMAQPQHARVEAHCDDWLCLGVDLATDGIPSIYHPSIYEHFIETCTVGGPFNGLFATKGCNQVLAAFGLSYPVVFAEGDSGVGTEIQRFPLPRDFWTTTGGSAGNNGAPGMGIAEYTNAGFIGAATNFKGTPAAPTASSASLPQPDGHGSTVLPVPLNDPSLLGSTAASALGSMSFLQTPVTDYLQASVTANPRSSTASMYSAALQQLGVQQDFPGSLFSYNRFNAAAAATLLIPRAIGYSAGLINYFFRGKIGISVPREGVYGIRDQAVQYGPDGLKTDPLGTTQGFRSIKVNLSNQSPTGEAMTNGSLRAILRYRRNTHFKDDLSEEPGSPSSGSVRGLTAVRGTTDEYVVSSAVFDETGTNEVADGAVTLTGTGQEFVFQFKSSVLPLNSTDVYLQVAWQGTLGSESNAVVTSTVDIGEPTYFTVYNSLDYINIQNKLYTLAQINADPNLVSRVRPVSCVVNKQVLASCFPANAPVALAITAGNGTQSTTPLVVLSNLPAQRYVRLAVLTDAHAPNSAAYAQTTLTYSGKDGGFTGGITALNNEFVVREPTRGSPVIDTDISDLDSFRGINGWDYEAFFWDGDGSGANGDDAVFGVPPAISYSGTGSYPDPIDGTGNGNVGAIIFPLH